MGFYGKQRNCRDNTDIGVKRYLENRRNKILVNVNCNNLNYEDLVRIRAYSNFVRKFERTGSVNDHSESGKPRIRVIQNADVLQDLMPYQNNYKQHA